MNMNINDLTLGQAKELTAMFSAQTVPATSVPDPLQGKFVICRCYSAGVHAGFLVSQEKDIVLLSSSRRLWSWKAKEGIALSGVAAFGLAQGCKIDSEVELIRLTGVIETILCSDEAIGTINK